MTGVEILAGVSLLGTGIQTYSGISGASSRAEQMRRENELKRLQANELLARQAINEQIMTRESGRMEGRAITAFASTGREGAGLGDAIQIHNNLLESIANTRRDAEFKASMLRRGADVGDELASDVAAAGWLSGVGTILTGGYDFANKAGWTKTDPGGKLFGSNQSGADASNMASTGSVKNTAPTRFK